MTAALGVVIFSHKIELFFLFLKFFKPLFRYVCLAVSKLIYKHLSTQRCIQIHIKYFSGHN